MTSPRRKLLLLDTFALIFRAFYGRARSGQSMQTSDGQPTEAVYIFNNMLKRLLDEHSPDYVAAVWEGEGPTFRDTLYPRYKANRAETPEDLETQFPIILDLLKAWNIQVLDEDGFEADDTIALLTELLSADGNQDVWIVSSDKDLMQTVRPGVFLFNPTKAKLYDSDGVREFLGVAPERVADFLALRGDPVDNIPGAPGIGEKGAKGLIAQYGDIEEIIRHADDVKRKTYRESLQNNADQIRLSKSLATLSTSGTLRPTLESLRWSSADHKALIEIYRKLEFKSLAARLERDTIDTPAAVEVRSFETDEQVGDWVRESTAPIAIALLDRGNGEGAARVGLCAEDGVAWELPPALEESTRHVFEQTERPLWVHDWKAAIHHFQPLGLDVRPPADDTMLMSFLTDSSRTTYTLEKTVERRLASAWRPNAGQAAVQVRRLRDELHSQMDSQGVRDLYREVDLPLIPILARMENAGVRLDAQVLVDLSSDLATRIDALRDEIYEHAGGEFKIGSPKQLGQVLFERLGLRPPARRGKSKNFSTASNVLEGLAADHPIVEKVLAWRKHTKIKSTYTDTLPKQVDADGRLRTTFNPTGSATGRLSSSDPNLQNIPSRTEIGQKIRGAFQADPGCVLLAADYSQIELRVLAHLCGDERLQEAFRTGADVHTMTAAEVLGVPAALVDAEMRKQAKAVNFGIIYGQSAFGLAKELGITRGAAQKFINSYFERYSTVREFIKQTIETTKKNGFSETIFGRRRPVPGLGSRNPAARGFAQRIAVNSPIQGSAADLIKKAMIATDAALRNGNLGARMLLQLHDELILEVPEAEVDQVRDLVTREMEIAASLCVPLVVDVRMGPNWRDLKAVA